MLIEIYQKDNSIFKEIVYDFKEKSYHELSAMPLRKQLSLPSISEHTTIECSQTFFAIDGALYIVLTQFLWLAENNDPCLIDGMHKTIIPMPNPNADLYYSGHCQTEFFYILPDDFVTDDIFVRNERAEERVIETADWFNSTGLTTEEERELPRYMRYEYGDLLVDDDGLKANDLTFIGKFTLTKKLFAKLQLNSHFQPKAIYIWHYKNNHYAYAYRDSTGVLQYELSNSLSISDYIKQPNQSAQFCPNRY